MSIITNNEDLAAGYYIPNSSDFLMFKPYLDLAEEKFVRPFLGSLLDVLNTALVGDTPAEKYTTLKLWVSAVIAPYGLYLAANEIAVLVGGSGISVSRTNTLAPVNDTKLENLRQNWLLRAWESVDLLQQFLRLKKNDYPEWDAEVFCFGSLISTTAEWTDATRSSIHRIQLEQKREQITHLEQRASCDFGANLIRTLITTQYTENSITRKHVITQLRKWIAAQLSDSPESPRFIKMYTEDILTTLKANATDFPEYTLPIEPESFNTAERRIFSAIS